MTSHVTTHVLDTALGRPATGVAVTLSLVDERVVEIMAVGTTDDDGRLTDLGPEHLAAGTYRLTFDTGAYFARDDRPAYFPVVEVTFVVDSPEHHHVPLLLSPFAYSTYRGS
ncbi:hydroxyisourate hydrolase [Mumia sp. ZJ1417]|uniref:hydroxyisourate hydrolase n=1 Tax=unclassified Mumia TaxID=2621872 RepID=UPI00141F0476|nr:MULTISPECIES: hydroxyisourate hydrolase [unclassified Mumia]QMW65853.1 hydroxyisourate hydrolase [Mumia sp. ZJ1417]